MTALENLTQMLEKIEADYEKKRVEILEKNLTVPVCNPDGTMSMVKHYVGKERKMEEKQSIHRQVNPELSRLRQDMYKQKSVVFQAYNMVVNANQ